MKKIFYVTLVVFIACLLIVPWQQAKAQSLQDTTNVISNDSMYVAWMQSDGSPRVDALRTAILSDTAVGGARKSATRTYVLKVNGFYWEANDLAFSFPLTIVGQSVSGSNYPPMLQMTDTKPDGTAGAGHLFTASSDFTLKNIYVTGCTNVNGTQTAYQPITFPANNHTFTIDNCVFTRSNFSLVVITGTGNTVSVTNCKFRNLIESPPTQQWTGRGVSIWADQVSVIMENNTFFNVGFATFQMEGGSSTYLLYNHNTIVNVGRGIMSSSGDWWQNAYFANNLIINGWWEGEGYADMHSSGRDPRSTYSGLFTVNTLPTTYGTLQNRRIVVTNTKAYLDPVVIAKYGATDSITRAWFLDPVSAADYVNPYTVASGNGHIFFGDTGYIDHFPTGMFNYLTDPAWMAPLSTTHNKADMIDSMWAFITQVRDGGIAGTPYGGLIYTTFFYKPTLHNSDEVWPLPENFSYTDASLLTAGSDGFPLGDLNWFPTQKASYLANRQFYVNKVQDKAGANYVQVIKSKVEAELGGLSGTATQGANVGFIYWDYENAGQLQWTFTVPAGKAGLYSTKWQINLDGKSGSQGMVLEINGKQINDKALGWGATPFAYGSNVPNSLTQVQGAPANDWCWIEMDTTNCTTPAAFTLPAGTNTIGAYPGGWNGLLFAEVDLAPFPTAGASDTIRCKGADAVADKATAGAVGIPWVASSAKYVTLGSAGKDTLTFTADTTGSYLAHIFGQNLSGSNQTITLSENGTTLITAALPCKTVNSKVDSTGNDVVTAAFTLTKGAHKIVLSGANANIDYLQFIYQYLVTGVSASQHPSAFALEQNYPNPFNPSTKINFTLAKAANVKLTVYNLLGQKVATLLENRMDAGQHSVTFDASKLTSGVYFYRIEAGDFTMAKKMLLLK
ncbi:MAG TPA: T9SS type A sorting domain-containing protein [Bacteroidota bacterium]|nr:T9SS type A sorting domain-containing protein [Bacteroidota bacterium]